MRQPRGPCCTAMPIRPSSTCGSAPSASRGLSLSASATTTAAERTGRRPESTASFTGALAALAKACATVTSCPAPPERVEGAQCRTQPTVVVACAPPVVSPRASASLITATLAASQAPASASSSPSSGPRSSPLARQSSPSRPCSAECAAASRSRRRSSPRLPSMTTTLEATTDGPMGRLRDESDCAATELAVATSTVQPGLVHGVAPGRPLWKRVTRNEARTHPEATGLGSETISRLHRHCGPRQRGGMSVQHPLGTETGPGALLLRRGTRQQRYETRESRA